MEPTYKLTILGYPVNSTSEIEHCFSMLTFGLAEEFKKLEHVKVSTYKWINGNTFSLDDFPASDFIIAINWGTPNDLKNYNTLKKYCKKYCTFLELRKHGDFSFIFKKEWVNVPDRCVYIPFPYYPALYKREVKEPKTILIDHFDTTLFGIGGSLPEEKMIKLDWTRNIYEWIKPLAGEYKICAMWNKNSWCYPELTKSWIPNYITPVSTTNFNDYINFISKIEQHITPCVECYPFSVLDSLILGNRVIAPPNFIPSCFVDTFKLGTFANQEQLLARLTEPLNNEELNNNIEKCTPMTEVVKIIDATLKEYL